MTSTTKQESKRSRTAKNITPKKRAGLSPVALVPIGPGLTTVFVADPKLVLQARLAVTRQAIACSDRLGLPMPKAKKVKSLITGTARVAEQQELGFKTLPKKKTDIPHEIFRHGRQKDFRWASDEGLATLLPAFEKNAWIIFQQHISKASEPALSAALAAMREKAKQSDCHVMAIFSCDDSSVSTQLQPLSDDYLEVRSCEPDIGFDGAFSIECPSLEELERLGLEKVMCSVKFEDGKCCRRYTPFIAQSLEHRVIWTLRGNKWTFEKIAKLLGMSHRSGPLRALQQLPPPRSMPVTDEWVKAVQEHFQSHLQPQD